ncbi:hypothetical protein H2200_011736 [Cladophialophora chaetospira]|uniref:Uncharacterized protein n=1 Tax=Cladophialophora chaetospira TaxID=386627 RepID=A0AA38WYN1_9EURO|nr:hypothetical protein H2200_011736 [Cladophialophora chaetospira]
MALRKSFLLVIIFILVHVLLTTPNQASATPIASSATPQGRKHKPGKCAPGYVWSVAQPISTLGATCCPDGYKAEQAKILGDLAGVFCCPEDAEETPCNQEDREMPTTPEKCPSPGHISGALCMDYYW